VGSLEGKEPQEKDYEHIKRLLDALTRFKAVLEPFFPEGAPFPSALYKAVQKWEKACKPKPKEEKPAPAAGAAGGSGGTAGGAGGAAGQQVSMNNPKEAIVAVKKSAGVLIDQEKTKPMGYRILRASRWDLLQKAPPAENGKTQLAAPNAQQRTYFQNLQAQSDWKTAIEKGEAAFTAGANHLWLDLQRIEAAACKELGAEYAVVLDAILFETARLIKRIPELADLSFNDGSAFCDPATKDWLTGDVAAVFASGDGGDSGSSGGGDDVVAEEQKEVNALVGAGKIDDALGLMEKALANSSQEADNFKRSVIIAGLLMKGKKPDVAVSFLEALDEKIDQYNLGTWAPDLSVEAWSILYNAYAIARVQKPQNVQVEMTKKQNAILNKISRVSPRKAFQLHK